jgi:hypothetical protein
MSEPICEICGKRGWHEPCSRAAAEAQRRGEEADKAMLAKHAKHGAFGLQSTASGESYEKAKDLLETFLGRPVRAPAKRSLEGNGWWFIPEGWIGMLGFVVEVESRTVFPLGSGLQALYGNAGNLAPWGVIEAYLSGEVEGVHAC